MLAKLYAEQDRTDVALEKMPQQLRQAVIATEDRRFYEHRGVDPIGTLRAVVVDVLAGEKKQGGSTITQQYAKNAFVTQEKTLARKIKEALLAQRLERRYSKDEILELYLNTIYFGHGAYGVESASQTYFGKPVDTLDLAESAMLAGVIKSPGRYSPHLEPDAARDRRNTVLKQMLDQGVIDKTEYEAAVKAPIKVAALKSTSTVAPYFVEYVKAQLAEEYGADALYRGGLRVRTTLDLPMQRAAEQAVAAYLKKPKDPSAALVTLDPRDGRILAMVGGRDFATQQFNVAAQGQGRQPGSAFKPFVLATALQEGVSPEKTFESGAQSFTLPDGQTWKVTGASKGRTGPMRLREATEKSVNSVFARLIMDIGPERVVDTATKLGIDADLQPVPAIALGGTEQGVTPLEMASAYGTLAAAGKHAAPYSIRSVRDAAGKVLFEAKPSVEQAIDEKVAYLTTDVLKGVIAKGTGKAAAIGRPAAGKTGTTQKNRDAWFVGYTPELVTAVWVGYPEAQRSMGDAIFGGSIPARIWAKFMSKALAKAPKTDFTKPEGIEVRPACAQTGLLATAYCPTTFRALFFTGSVPASCTVHAFPTKVTVPKLVGLPKAEALALAQKALLKVTVTESAVPGVAAGVVASQSPAAGSSVATQTTVTIVVSKGTPTDRPPTAQFSAPAEATVGQPVAFDASASSDDGKIVTYVWEFGDGGKATGKTGTHTYSQVGTYEVTLWVTDDHNQASSISHTLVVK